MTPEQEALVEALRAVSPTDEYNQPPLSLLRYIPSVRAVILALAAEREDARALFAGHVAIVEETFRIVCDAAGKDKSDADDMFKSAKLSYLPEYVAAVVKARDAEKAKSLRATEAFAGVFNTTAEERDRAMARMNSLVHRLRDIALDADDNSIRWKISKILEELS